MKLTSVTESVLSKVSVILTSYNHEKYIRQSIESILKQTFTDFELIIWDDASTDKSWEIINSYHDARIKSFRNKTNQRSNLINRALKEVASGKYIAIHHSDDIWELDKLEKQVNVLNNNPKIGAVFTKVKIINDDGSLFDNKNHDYFNVFNQKNKSRHRWLRSFFMYGNSLCHPSVLIRKKCYQECGLYTRGLGQLPDFEMWIRVLLKYEIHVIQQKLTQFRILNDSKNTSAPSIINSTRILNEYTYILKNFLKIKSLEDFYLIFPEAKKIKKINQYKNITYAFALMCIKYKPTQTHLKFGIDLLLELVNSSQVDFNAKKIISLNGQFDFYNLQANSELQQAIKDKDTHIANLENEIFSIRNSLSFKIGKPVRFFGRVLLKAKKL